MKIPTFQQNATNVYRTKKYIVKQMLQIQYDSINNAQIISLDTYYKRTPMRDFQYTQLFKQQIEKNGRRLHCTMYKRKYVN